jgi:hypothetical protein
MQQEGTIQILVYYDGSSEAEHAVDAAAALFAKRRAVVLEVAPTLTFAEGLAAASSSVPGRAFEDLNTADALQRAEAGAEHARSAGLDAVGRAVTASSTCAASSTPPRRSTRLPSWSDRGVAPACAAVPAEGSRTRLRRMRAVPC